MTLHVECTDVREWAKQYRGEPFHALLCDPPYELAFMGRKWDSTGVSFQPDTWAALAEHLLPGAFIMAFGGSRTYHRLACAIEDAGLVIHSAIGWAFGSGFPKATRIDTQVDKTAGAKQQYAEGPYASRRPTEYGNTGTSFHDDAYLRPVGDPRPVAQTDLARTWAGHRYGLQALKPALEFICVAQKPYRGKPVESITATGAGALNIDQSRIRMADGDHKGEFGEHRPETLNKETTTGVYGGGFARQGANNAIGRWPSNLLLSHLPGCRQVGSKRASGNGHYPAARPASTTLSGPNGHGGQTGLQEAYTNGETVADWQCEEGCPVKALGQQAPDAEQKVKAGYLRNGQKFSGRVYEKSITRDNGQSSNYADAGSCSRFFYNASWSLDIAEQLDGASPVYYCAKASRAERDKGLGGMPADKERVIMASSGRTVRNGEWTETYSEPLPRRNGHPCCKPLSLCRHLATLILPPAAYAPRRLLVPFGGSGSEGIGGLLAGWEEILLVEREAEYVPIAEARARYWQSKMAKQLRLEDVCRA